MTLAAFVPATDGARAPERERRSGVDRVERAEWSGRSESARARAAEWSGPSGARRVERTERKRPSESGGSENAPNGVDRVGGRRATGACGARLSGEAVSCVAPSGEGLDRRRRARAPVNRGRGGACRDRWRGRAPARAGAYTAAGGQSTGASRPRVCQP
jgi:hypothetical protein